MGCDIHLVIEYRTKQQEPWLLLRTPIPSKYASEEGVERDLLSDCLLRDRSYSFFGILAGVRAVEGEPISEPRGLPVDMSDGLRDLLGKKEWVLGDHSFSWLTFDEIHGHPRYHEIEVAYPLWYWLIDSIVCEMGYRLSGYDFRIVFGFDS